MDSNHHARRVEELDNCLDGQIRVRRQRSEENHGLGRRELLLLGHWGARSLEVGTKYGTAATPSPSLAAGGGEEEGAEPSMRTGAGERRDSSGGA